MFIDTIGSQLLIGRRTSFERQHGQCYMTEVTSSECK